MHLRVDGHPHDPLVSKKLYNNSPTIVVSADKLTEFTLFRELTTLGVADDQIFGHNRIGPGLADGRCGDSNESDEDEHVHFEDQEVCKNSVENVGGGEV